MHTIDATTPAKSARWFTANEEVMSERPSNPELELALVGDGGNLLVSRRRRCARTEVAVDVHHVGVIEDVEALRHQFYLMPWAETQRARQPDIERRRAAG